MDNTVIHFKNVTLSASFSAKGLMARIGTAAASLGNRDGLLWNTGVRIIRYDDFSLDKGKCIALCGNDHFVQDTLLDMITNQKNPATGEIEINGILSSAKQHRKRLHGRHSAVDLLSRNAFSTNKTTLQTSLLIEKILIFSDLLAVGHVKLNALSFIEKVQLSTAIALLTEADGILLESYLFGCQQSMQNKILDRIHLQKWDNKAILIAAPETEYVRSVADRYISYKLL